MAEQVGLSEWAVRQAIRDGELQASKLRGRLRIDAVDLQAWVDGSRVRPVVPVADAPPVFKASPMLPAAGSVREMLRRERKEAG